MWDDEDRGRDEDLDEESTVTEAQVERIEESAEKIEQKTTLGNALKIAIVVSTLLLAATINSLANIPATVKENTKEIEATVKRMDRHVSVADRHFDEIREDVKELRALQIEILKELRK